MKAEELRIGNYIMDSDTDRIGHVVRLSKKKVSVKLEHSTLWQDIDEFEPIPLSEEVLLSIKQFRNIGENFYSDDNSIIIQPAEKYYYVFLGSEGVKIKYLHQLQNLYYALTGEELEINL